MVSCVDSSFLPRSHLCCVSIVLTMAVASAELLAIFQAAGVSKEVIAVVTAKGIVTTATFANSCNNKSEVKDTFLASTASASDLVQIACLKQAWREAERTVEQKLTRTTPDLTSLEDLECALPQTVQLELETAFMRRYSWLRIPSKSIGCDSLLGRIRREFDRRALSEFRVSKVRSRAQSSLADPCKHRRLSEYVACQRRPRGAASFRPHGLLRQDENFGFHVGRCRQLSGPMEWRGGDLCPLVRDLRQRGHVARAHLADARVAFRFHAAELRYSRACPHARFSNAVEQGIAPGGKGGRQPLGPTSGLPCLFWVTTFSSDASGSQA